MKPIAFFRRVGFQLLGLGFVVVAVAAFANQSDITIRDHASATQGASFVVPSNCVSCSTCALSTIRHVASYDVNGDFKNSHADCLDFPGCSGHPACGTAAAPAELALEAILSRAFRGDSGATRDLFQQFPKRVRFNAQRMAIQVAGCRADVIVAHMPLSVAQLAEIADLPQVTQELASR